MSKKSNQVEVVEVALSSKELIANAIAKLSPEELAAIYPPISRANFVVRKSWLGRNQVITFVNNKNQRITYNHDAGSSVNTGHNLLICQLMLDI
jgi:hypothetical protein